MVFKFPAPPGCDEDPVWTGKGFKINSKTVPILQYTGCDEGWNPSLTEFHEIETDYGNYYIDKASRLHACTELGKYLLANGVVLEIGSSSGYLLRDIQKKNTGIFIIGSDCIPEPLKKIAEYHPDIPLIQFDLINCPLPDNSVDVVVALNVLEHIENDVTALQQIHRILKPGGYAIIEVPANQDLYDFYDEQLKHFRRYSIRELSKLAEDAGFLIHKSSHLGFFIYPTFRYIKLRNKQKMNQNKTFRQENVKDLIHLGGSVMNTVLYSIMRFELVLGKMIRYPWGIRCLITLSKKK